MTCVVAAPQDTSPGPREHHDLRFGRLNGRLNQKKTPAKGPGPSLSLAGYVRPSSGFRVDALGHAINVPGVRHSNWTPLSNASHYSRWRPRTTLCTSWTPSACGHPRVGRRTRRQVSGQARRALRCQTNRSDCDQRDRRGTLLPPLQHWNFNSTNNAGARWFLRALPGRHASCRT